jgi:multidrug efflux pump subunit AcrA (membrane-fusion protein)
MKYIKDNKFLSNLMNKILSVRKFIIILILISIIAGIFTVFFIPKKSLESHEEEKLLPRAKVKAVKIEKIKKRMRYYGNVTFSKKFEIYPKLKEKIKAIYVDKGDKVRKGQLIVKLEDSEILMEMEKAKNEVEKKKIDLAIAQQALEEAERDVRRRIRSIQSIEKDKESKELEIKNMEKILSNKSELVKVGGFSEESYRQLENQYNQLLLEYDKIKEQLKASKIGFSLEDVPYSMKQLVKKGGILENEDLFVNIHTRAEKLQIEKLKKEIEASEIVFKQLEMQYKNTFIYSPGDGEVAERFMYEGEFAFPDKPLLLIIDRAKCFVEFNVPESELLQIKRGETVNIKIGTQEYNAKVDRVYPIMDEKSRMATVRSILPVQDSYLLPGMFAIVSLFSSVEMQVFVLPVESILERKDKEGKVYIVNPNNYVIGRWVTIDSIEEDKAYVSSGLSENEYVIISTPSQYKEGMKVSIDVEK